MLSALLAKYNARDTDAISDHLDKLEETLSSEANIERFLLGGSVGKHTFVDGLSDIDALVILDSKNAREQSPGEILDSFHARLAASLPRDKVAEVTKGRLAVTVKYRDGTEIQLLPALRRGNKVAISTEDGRQWNETKPKLFQKALSRANERLNHALVPTIKLVKGVMGDMPTQKQMTGYHVESLALEVAKGYRGPKTVKSLLVHVLQEGAKRVLRPISDITEQSRIVDAALGAANSTRRRILSDALSGVARKLNSATTVDEWRAVLQPKEPR